MANEINNDINTLKVLVTKAEFIDKTTNQPKILIGFGSVGEYEGKAPGARDVMGKVSAINSFLQAADAGKIPVTMKATDENKQPVFMKVDCFKSSGVSKAGMAYSYQKMAFELQPEKRNEAGELLQNRQVLYATKGKDGYSFDKDSDPTLVARFNKIVENGVDLTLLATSPKTLDNYPVLMNVVNQINSAAKIGIGFVKQKGAVLTGEIEDVSKKSGEIGQGAQQLANLATPAQAKDKGMEI